MKKLKDWTLGEVQKVCVPEQDCAEIGCPFYDRPRALCKLYDLGLPYEWDLTDTPVYTQSDIETLTFLKRLCPSGTEIRKKNGCNGYDVVDDEGHILLINTASRPDCVERYDIVRIDEALADCDRRERK